MESFRRTFAQFRDLFMGMAPSQRMTLVAVPLMVLAGLGMVMYVGMKPAEEYLLAGKTFSAEEMKQAENALRQAGMTQFHSEGQKILVPKAELTRYNAALVEKGGLPAQFGAEMEKAHDNFGMFASDKERQERLDIVKAKELSKIIRAIPGIENASVIWERSRSRGFNASSKVTATVSVVPRGGRDISSELAHSLRMAVAGAVADLSPENVTVLDMHRGIAIRAPDRDDPFNSQFVDQIRKFTTLHQRNISEALSFIPHSLVTVNVDLENLKTSWEQERKFDTKPFPLKSTEQTDTQKSDERKPNEEPGVKSNQPRNVREQAVAQSTRSSEKTVVSNENVPISQKVIDKTFVGLLPKTVQVSVSIPKDYYRAVAQKQGENESDKAAFQAKVQQIETETLKSVEKIVARLIPPTPTGSPVDSISVNSYVRLDSDPLPLEVPMMDKIGDGVTRWGGPVGLAIFALWALRMLNRSLKSLPQPKPQEVAKSNRSSSSNTTDEEEEKEEQPPGELTKRDQLQGLVRDNPEMAAAVIGRWIIPPK